MMNSEHQRRRRMTKAQKQTLYDQLYYGFEQQQETIQSIQIPITPRSIILPISTRSVGFMIRFLVCKFAQLQIRGVDFHNLCSALYRVALLQVEIKLMQVMKHQCSLNIGARETFVTIHLDSNIVQVVHQLRAYFGPLINLISSIGIVKAFGTSYIPRMLKATGVDHINRYDYDPTIVTFSTLHSYVMAMSSTATPYSVRKYFYDHSPFPNARWNVQTRILDDDINEDLPLLLNPTEILPHIYELNELRKDITIIQDSVELISRKYKCVHSGGIDYSGNGNSTVLPSNEVGDIRCTDLKWAGEDAIYSMTNPLTGTIDTFWSPERISDAEFHLGSIHLLGELIKDTSRTSALNVRSKDVAKQKTRTNYTANLQNLLSRTIWD